MIKMIRMKDGFEVVGEVVSENNTSLEIQNPLEIVTTSRMLGHILTFQRFMPLSLVHCHVFNKSDILCQTWPSKKIAEYYKVTLETLIPKFDEQLDKELDRAIKLFQTKEIYDEILQTIDTSNLTKQ